MSDKPRWQDLEGRTFQPSIVKEQRKLLLRLKALLEGEVEKQKKSVSVVREQLHRMQHGGGS